MAVRHRADRRLPWQVYWNNPHTGRRESKSFASQVEAEKHDSLILHRLRHEPETFPSAAHGADALTVESLVYLYLKARDFKPKNLRDTLFHVRPILAVIGGVLVTGLEASDLRRAVASQRAAGLKQNTINRRISIIKAALNWGEDEGHIAANPVPRFSCPRGEDERIAPPTHAEIEAILSVASERIQRMILLALALGVRVGESEMFRLRWEDFDLNRGTVRIWAAEKNAKRPWRDLHLRPDLLPILRAWREDGEEYVFHAHNRSKKRPGQGRRKGRVPVSTLKSSWASALKAAGIKRRLRPYDLRHAFATYSLDSGADPKAVAEVMGHADMSMIHRHYQHVLERQRKAVMEAAPLPDLGTFSGHMKEGFGAHFQGSGQKIKQ